MNTTDIIILSDEQKQIINQSQKDYLEGNYVDNSCLKEEIERWLNDE